jgi:Glycosyltransferase family 87
VTPRKKIFVEQFARLDRTFSSPLSNVFCVLGWCVATALFVTIVNLLGGPTSGDANVSVFVTWSLAHGHLACGYPAPGVLGYAPTAPLYPLLTGVLAALFRIGHHVPFPSSSQLGANCVHSTAAINHWALAANAWSPTLRLGFIGWLFLMAGVITLLRSSGRGRCGWEPLTLILVACTPPVVMCLAQYFHPQDMVALGLALMGLGCVVRQRWLWAGVLLGLAITSQQFSLLIFLPLIVVVPRPHWPKFLGSAAVAALCIDVPMLLLTSGRAITSVLVGTGESSTTNSLLDNTGLQGSPLFDIARFLPLALALVLAWWTARRLGPRLLEPVALTSLVASALCLRLVFEVNLWGYYFMAVAAMLVVLCALRRRISILLVIWIILVTWASIFGALTNGGPERWPPVWLCQILLVPLALFLCVQPLMDLMREDNDRSVTPGENRPERVRRS